MMIQIFKWFKSIIGDMITENGKTIDALLEETRAQNTMLEDVVEALKPETVLRIKNISKTEFDLSVHEVCAIIKTVKEQNHIADRAATETKVATLLVNLHEDRNSRLDYFKYKGKPLSQYVRHDWIDWVKDVVLKEVYAQTSSQERTRSNVDAVYRRIKLDFYHNLDK